MFDVEAVPGRRPSRRVDDPRNWRVAVPGRYPPGARPYIVHDLMLTWYIQRDFCAFSITFYRFLIYFVVCLQYSKKYFGYLEFLSKIKS